MHDIESVARLPVIGATVLMCDCKHGCQLPIQVVTHRIRKSIQHVKTNSVFVGRPHVSALGQTVNRVKNLHTKGICSNWAALEIPEECLAELPFGFRQDLDSEPRHIALMRARTSDQGAPCTIPARRSARRRNNSVRQAPATELSSLVSKLSISAAATAERSSAESRSISSSTRSIRAFMGHELSTPHAESGA